MKKEMLLLLCILLAGLAGIHAQTPCNAAFGWQANPNGNNLFNVDFYNNSTGPTTSPSSNIYTTFSINYGDGSGVSNLGSTSSHNYPGAGIYTVTVIVSSYDSTSAGITQICTDTETGVVTLNSSPCATTFTAQNNGSSSYTFTANTPAGTSGMTYSWNFGDNTVGTGSPVTHVYNTSGNFTITLTSTGGGCTYTNINALTSLGVPAVFNCSSASADFNASVTNSTVYFSNQSSGQQGNSNVSSAAAWDFGDGYTSTAYNANHTYSAVGTYIVGLVNSWTDSITSTLLCTKTAYDTITITSLSPQPSTQNEISGMITFDTLNGMQWTNTIKVWLIMHDANANTLTAVDSQNVAPFNAYYNFPNKPAGDYLVKANFVGQNPGTAGYLSTYHQASVYWGSATTIAHTIANDANKNIHLQNGTVTSGPGFIGGNISAGAGKGTGTGIKGMLVYLRGSNNQLITSTVTDDEGDYSFSDLPAGTYNVYPEAINYNTTPYNSIAVTAGQPHVSAIDFEINATEIKPKNVTGIDKVNPKDGLKIYPNPAKNTLTIENQNGNFNQVKIINAVGQLIKEVNLKNGINKVDINEMNAGIYYLLISGKDGTRSLKFVKQ